MTLNFGVPFRQHWVSRLFWINSLERLAYGQNVTNVALKVGYESPSSFIAAFRAIFGTIPAIYF
ncbi:helix-turn-helix domain-containing protein [Citrobacter freundii]|uniref:helix-turn-helix domain-containing protein n=1 Tax=Citrobacter freundii TaxID=546 RepID=UPI0029502972|nr:helix-turn-helix domain-containing protein [Citrobacter freundii]EMB4690490.1 helix-turn-helix domain-containing protein [Citrobacter farmeri]